MRKGLFTALRISVSAILIAALLYSMRGQYQQVMSVIKGMDVGIFLTGLLIFSCAHLIVSLRLKLIIQAQEISVKFFETVYLTLIGYFFNNFLPTAIGGDVVKAYYLSRKSSDKIGAVASIFVDRLIGLFTMVFMACGALFFFGNGLVEKSVARIIYMMTLGALALLILLANQTLAKTIFKFMPFLTPLAEKLKAGYAVVNKYRHHKVLMMDSFFISIISQMLFFFCLWFLALSIGTHIPIKDLYLRMPIIGIIALLPSINGLGLREGSTVVFFGPLIGKENAFAVSILWLFILFITSIIGGLVYALFPQFKVKAVKNGV